MARCHNLYDYYYDLQSSLKDMKKRDTFFVFSACACGAHLPRNGFLIFLPLYQIEIVCSFALPSFPTAENLFNNGKSF